MKWPHHLNLQSIQSMALGSCLVSTTTTVCEELKVFNNLSSSSVLIMWQLYFKENWHLTNQLQCQWSPQEMHQITQIVSSTPDGLQWIELFSLAPFICHLYAHVITILTHPRVFRSFSTVRSIFASSPCGAAASGEIFLIFFPCRNAAPLFINRLEINSGSWSGVWSANTREGNGL